MVTFRGECQRLSVIFVITHQGKHINISLLITSTWLSWCTGFSAVVTIFLFHNLFFRSCSLKERDAPLLGKGYLSYLEFSLQERFFIFHLFIQLFMSKWSHRYLFYTNTVTLLSNCSSVGHWLVFKLAPVLSFTYPHPFAFSALPCFLALLARLILYYFCEIIEKIRVGICPLCLVQSS